MELVEDITARRMARVRVRRQAEENIIERIEHEVEEDAEMISDKTGMPTWSGGSRLPPLTNIHDPHFSVCDVRADPAAGCWSHWLVCLATTGKETSKTCETDRYRWASNIGRHGGGPGADWRGAEGLVLLQMFLILIDPFLSARARSRSIWASFSTSSSTTSTPRPSPWLSSRRWSCPQWTLAASPILMSRWKDLGKISKEMWLQ